MYMRRPVPSAVETLDDQQLPQRAARTPRLGRSQLKRAAAPAGLRPGGGVACGLVWFGQHDHAAALPLRAQPCRPPSTLPRGWWLIDELVLADQSTTVHKRPFS